MKVVFRADASLDIGSGHVMRCLTLAEALTGEGVECHFVTRLHDGHLVDFISSKGHHVHALPPPSGNSALPGQFASWLGVTQAHDASQTKEILIKLHADWVVVDHYALDGEWEKAARIPGLRMMAVDDLADRSHQVEILLDQNLGTVEADYAHLLPASCHVLAGPRFALLRAEFAKMRSLSLQRRRTHSAARKLLISMGGVDRDNVTAAVLDALDKASLPPDSEITVIMGAKAPWLQDIRHIGSAMRYTTTVLTNVENMASLMAASDLAVGAAGGTAWERCCVGLPSLIIVLADNQIEGATALHKSGAARLLSESGGLLHDIQSNVHELFSEPKVMTKISEVAAAITDGLGAKRVVEKLLSFAELQTAGDMEKAPSLPAFSAQEGRLRPLNESDLETVLAWRNHPDIRMHMYTQHVITLVEHQAWFKKAKTDPRRHLFIYEENGCALGYVNLSEVHEVGTADWGFYIAPSAEKGTGARLGLVALSYAFSELKLRSVTAEVLTTNERSLRFHSKLGFQLQGTDDASQMSKVVETEIARFTLFQSDWNKVKKDIHNA